VIPVRLKQFSRLLDVYGPELGRWPAGRREAAHRLLAADPAAAAALAAARQLGALLDRIAAVPALPSRERVSGLLARLPAQQPASWWRAPLLLWDLLPRWPRAVALATMTALGILVGMTDGRLAPLVGSSAATASSAAGGTDVSSLIFDPTPAIGLGR
jgi:anti-sigma factor RsiW